MVTTVEALQGLYVSKGGSLEDVKNLSTIPDMIEALSGIETEDMRPITSSEVNTIINSIV